MKTVPWKIIIVSALSLTALYLRFDALAGRELWNDENYQRDAVLFPDGKLKKFWLNSPHKDIAAAGGNSSFIKAPYGDFSAFPGDYLLVFPAIKMFGTNKWAMAMGHILATVFGLYLLYKLCGRLLKTIWGYVVTFLIVCFNSNLIFHAFELRPYAVLPTLAIGAVYFSYRVVEDYDRLSLLKKALIALFFFCGINFHAYGLMIFALAFGFVYLAKNGGRVFELFRSSYRNYVVSIFFAAAVVWWWYASVNFSGASPSSGVGYRNTFQFIPDPASSLGGFAKGIVGNLLGNRIFYIFLPVAGLAFLWNHSQRVQQLLFFILLVVLPIGLILWVDIRTDYWFVQRQFVWVMPLFAVWVGWCVDSVIAHMIKKQAIKKQGC